MHFLLAPGRYFQNICGYVGAVAATSGKDGGQLAADHQGFPVGAAQKHFSSSERTTKFDRVEFGLIHAELLIY